MADWTSSVRSYLRERLLTVTGLPSVGYEGRIFTPLVNTPWIREFLMPLESPVVSLGGSGQVREDFIYQLTVYTPLTGGRITDHDDLVDRIRAAFFPGFTIRDQSSRFFGTIVQSDRSPMMTEPGWMSTEISIRAYYHRAMRAA